MVSIIIPIYNSEKYLHQCLTSVCGQTYENIEIILINDGSTDRSSDICHKFLALDKRIKLIEKENGGVSSARNLGINISTGEYIMFVDADDYLDCFMVEKLITAIKKVSADLSICGYVKKDKNEEYVNIPKQFLSSENEIANFFEEYYLSWVISSPWRKLYRRDKIKNNFEEKMSFGEDMLFNINYIQNTFSIVVISDCLYYYRKSETTSLSNRYRKNDYNGIRNIYETSINYIDIMNRKYSINIEKRKIAYRFYYFSMGLLIKQHMNSGIKYQEKVEYLKSLVNDTLFTTAISNVKNINWLHRLMIWMLMKKHIRIVYFMSAVRAGIKKMKVKRKYV